jgi:hypothetical protein
MFASVAVSGLVVKIDGLVTTIAAFMCTISQHVEIRIVAQEPIRICIGSSMPEASAYAS